MTRTLLAALLVFPLLAVAEDHFDDYDWRVRQEMTIDQRLKGSGDDWVSSGQEIRFTSFPTPLDVAIEAWYVKVCLMTGGTDCGSQSPSQLRAWAEGLIQPKLNQRR